MVSLHTLLYRFSNLLLLSLLSLQETARVLIVITVKFKSTLAWPGHKVTAHNATHYIA